MKDKLIIFIIGLLLGATISTGIFYVYTVANNNSNNNTQTMQMDGGQPPEKPDGENGQPPEMPNGSNPQGNNQVESN